jgi:hypothetical protein
MDENENYSYLRTIHMFVVIEKQMNFVHFILINYHYVEKSQELFVRTLTSFASIRKVISECF